MRVFVAGATGVIGKPLCAQLIAAGHEVTALTRDAKRADELRARGVTPVVADVFDAGAVSAAVVAARAEAVVHQLTAIPAQFSPRKVGPVFAPTNRLRTEGTRILLDAARAAGASRFIAQSISFVLPPDGPSPAAEEPVWRDPPAPVAAMFAAVADLETQVTNAGLVGIALRFGSLYGPGTIFASTGSMTQGVARRRVPLIGRGDGVFGFCHVDDAAGATVRALTRGVTGIYNVVDDDPAPAREWLPHLAGVLDAPPPRRVPAWLAMLAAGRYSVYLMARQRAVSNAKARAELGFTPSIASWRDGFRTRRDS
jgi:nucleoside-diphosphate-sugar epimerase